MSCSNLPSDFWFSFSSVNSYRNCPKCFWLTYLQQPKLQRQDNAFAQWGSFIHHLYESFYSGKLDFFDVCQEYEEHYADNVTLKFPYNAYVNLNEKYYETGLDALESFNQLPNNIEVLGIEQEIRLQIEGINFLGYADLILRNKDSGEIYIVDHKSKSKFASKREQKEYARQLYLYSLYVKETYGVYPTQLIFNMFRAGEIVKIEFNKNDLEQAVKWFVETVGMIQSDTIFIDKIKREFTKQKKKLSKFSKNDFFCNELCGVRKYCNRAKGKTVKV